MLFKKEKEVISLIQKFMDIVVNCLNLADISSNAYLSGDIAEAKKIARQVDTAEGDADLIRHEIRDKLYSGAYLPLLREDIYKLVESIDKVANASEACCDFFLNQRPNIPESFIPYFKKVIRESLGVREMLRDAVSCYLKGDDQVKAVREHAKAVGLKESEVDRLEWDLTKQLFTSDLDFCHKLHLKECLNAIAKVSDRAEDSADQLELVTLKTMY